MATLTLDIVTPEARIFSGPVLTVTLPGSEGEFCVFPEHNPLMTALVPGELLYTTPEGSKSLAIGDGFAEVSGRYVRVLTDLAVAEADIDEQVVQAALARAEEAMRTKTLVGEELEATEVAIARSTAQLQLKKRRRTTPSV